MSLRARVTFTALAVLTIALAAVGTFVYLALRSNLDNELRNRLADRAVLAQRLSAEVTDPQQLADRLSTEDTLAAVETDEGLVRGTPSPPFRRGGTGGPGRGPGFGGGGPPPIRAAAEAILRRNARISVDDDAMRLRSTLPGGETLMLVASRRDQSRALSRLLGLELGGSLLALAIAGGLLWGFLGRALRPLDDVRSVALGIARGRTGDRLRPQASKTELDRLGVAFDEMLDAQDAALARAQDAEARMRRFLADASHELRSPLAGVQATGETLLRDGDDRAERERLAVDIVREARRAGRLVDDLLAATRAGATSLDVRPVDLAELATVAVDRMRVRRPELAFELRADAGGARHVVVGDGDRLEQVLAGLLDNAVRAAAGRVRVTAADGALVVEDDGPGVPPGDRERIFERFVRLDAARARRDGGSGLGLAIARGLAEAHGGTLTCDGSPDLGGARMTLALPDRDVAAGSGDRFASGPAPTLQE